MIQIGTNFLYKGEQFLDNRLSIPKTIADLRNWIIPVPEGFEVFVEGDWYIYNSTYIDPEEDITKNTGHWKKRSNYEYPRSELKNIIDTDIRNLKTLQDFTGYNTLMFSNITPNQIYEIGYSFKPVITWTIQLHNNPIIPDRILINNVEITEEERIAGTYICPTLINSTTNFNIKAYYKEDGWEEDAFIETNVLIEFKYKKYFGISSSLSPDHLTELHSTWCDDWNLETLLFSTEGHYIYYLVPEDDIRDENGVLAYIGGILDSNINVDHQTLLNEQGVEHGYYVFRTEGLHYGDIEVTFVDKLEIRYI